MSEGVLRKYTGRSPELVGPSQDDDAYDDCGAFGWLRGIKDRCVMVQLQKRNGSTRALAYSLMDTVDFDPSAGITLSAAGHRVRITGRNLNAEVRPLVQLFEGLVLHRVSWVREATQAERVHARDEACIVESIEW